MELVTILRELWRLRLLVILSGVIAVVLGLITAYHVSPRSPHLSGRQYHVGTASAHLLVDTPASQTVDLSPNQDSNQIDLVSRATLLANLMGSDPVRDAIAANAHLAPRQLLISTPSGAGAPSPTLLALANTQQGASSSYEIDVSTAADVPIITIATQAPDDTQAELLANAATAGLQSYLRSVAYQQKVPNAQRLVVSTFGPAQGALATRGPRRMMALLVVIGFFLFACTAIVTVSGISRGWRSAAADERAADYFGPALAPDGAAPAGPATTKRRRRWRRGEHGAPPEEHSEPAPDAADTAATAETSTRTFTLEVEAPQKVG